LPDVVPEPGKHDQVRGRGTGAVLQSFGDNYVAGNGDGDRALPIIATK